MTNESISHTDQEPSERFNLMQTVKRRLYAMRNGALAAQMRRGGLDYRINFGLNIPQIKEIARDILDMGLTHAELLALGTDLWANEGTRESRLLAPMIFPPEDMTGPLAAQWLRQAQNIEIADHLCHSLLRRLSFAEAIANEVLSDTSTSDLNRYTALRLMLNLIMLRKLSPSQARKAVMGEQARRSPLTSPLVARIIEEAEFIEG